MSRDIEYEQANLVHNEEYYMCIKCKNHKVCNNLLPDRWFNYKGRYLCIPCERTFGKLLNTNRGTGELKFSDNVVCLQCNSKGEGVTYPRCDHYLCLQCFDNIWYSYRKIPNPKFPYNEEIEDKYYDDIMNDNNYKKWENYPLIKLYEKQKDLIERLREELFRKYEPLQECHICKK
jgi:hypothetical protein